MSNPFSSKKIMAGSSGASLSRRTFFFFTYLDCVKDGRDERQKKNGLYYTTTSADGRAIALLSLSGSSKGEATLCWRLSVQKNPQRRRGAFPGVQHMGGVVDKGCG